MDFQLHFEDFPCLGSSWSPPWSSFRSPHVPGRRPSRRAMPRFVAVQEDEDLTARNMHPGQALLIFQRVIALFWCRAQRGREAEERA